MKTLFFLVLMFTQTLWAYGLSGQWSGSGDFYINGVLQTEKCTLYLEMNHTTESFVVLKSEYKCPGMKIVNKAQNVLQIRNGQLFLNDTFLGYIFENKMNSPVFTPDGRLQSYNMKKNTDGSLFYNDYIEWNQSYATQIIAVLNPTGVNP